MVSPIIVMSLATTCGCFTLLVSTSPIGNWASSVSLEERESGRRGEGGREERGRREGGEGKEGGREERGRREGGEGKEGGRRGEGGRKGGEGKEGGRRGEGGREERGRREGGEGKEGGGEGKEGGRRGEGGEGRSMGGSTLQALRLVMRCTSVPDGMDSVGPRRLSDHLNLGGSDKEWILLGIIMITSTACIGMHEWGSGS